MADAALEALEEHLERLARPGSGSADLPVDKPDWFDERVYLALNPDIASEVAQGKFASGLQHYVRHGWRENRSLFRPGTEPQDELIELAPLLGAGAAAQAGVPRAEVSCNIEAAFQTRGGGLFAVGWVNDVGQPLTAIRLSTLSWTYTFSHDAIARVRRLDVEGELGLRNSHLYGFFCFVFLDRALQLGDQCHVEFDFGGTKTRPLSQPLRLMEETELRNLVMSYVGESRFFGNQQLESVRMLEPSLGAQVLAHNRHIVDGVTRGACIQRFGTAPRVLRGSIIVCLYGKAEFFFLQQALFARQPGMEDYEFIYVSNSPELAERLMYEATAAQTIYGLPVTLVLLPGNAGFGAANNVAARAARSDRLIIMNPDVFPKELAWARLHTEAVDQLPAEQTRLFGVPLYYDDGSLMHAGMYFEVDTAVTLHGGAVRPEPLVRVEHYGKGAPADATGFLRPRPVPAVTGAFIAVDRAWFERLGGFTEDFVFGHYEDADLCLKSIEAGAFPWIHDIRLWHLEGKGSSRLPVHEGGSTVNRWTFTKRWLALLESRGLRGPAPRLPAVPVPAAPRPRGPYLAVAG